MTLQTGGGRCRVTVWEITHHFFETVLDYTLTVTNYLILKSLCGAVKKVLILYLKEGIWKYLKSLLIDRGFYVTES